MNTKLKPYIRLVLAFGLCASIATCNPFLTALHEFALDTVSGAQDLALILMVGGAIMVAGSGGRIMQGGGFMSCLLGAFIALGATPITNWLRSLSGS